MRILVTCNRTLKVVHHHPHLHAVDEHIAATRPHLAHPHEHTFKLTVGLRVTALNRQKDLLLLHRALDTLTACRQDVGDASFEQICTYVKTRIPDAAMVRIEEHDEGAEIIFDEPQEVT